MSAGDGADRHAQRQTAALDWRCLRTISIAISSDCS
jgi:hypothetical protein